MAWLHSFLKKNFSTPPVARNGAREAAERIKLVGNEHLGAGRLDLACASFEEAIRLDSMYIDAYINLGFTLKELKRFDEAECSLLRAAAIDPKHWRPYFNMGLLAQDLGLAERAINTFEKALALASDSEPRQVVPILRRLADEYMERGDFSTAVHCTEQIIDSEPEDALAMCNLATGLHRINKTEEAIARLTKFLTNHADARVAHFLGLAYQQTRQLDQARRHYELALQIQPAFFDPLIDLAMLDLLQGHYESGWPKFEHVLPRIHIQSGIETEADRLRRELTPEKYWQGEPIPGKTLLVWTEQGFGDSLMMFRYLPLIAARNHPGRTVVLCEAGLVRICECVAGVDQVIAKPRVCDLAFDRHCSAMSLPYLFDTRLNTIPSKVPYFEIPAVLLSAWNRKLGGGDALRVGLSWGGNKALARDHLRSIPLRMFQPLMASPGIQWYSLQRGEPAAQIHELGWSIDDQVDQCSDFLDTAALTAQLDLVISVDTAIAHLAGSLGQTVWMLNRYESEWRWMVGRSDSPWYPTMRIFNQPALFDWDSVIAQVSLALQEWVSTHRRDGHRSMTFTNAPA